MSKSKTVPVVMSKEIQQMIKQIQDVAMTDNVSQTIRFAIKYTYNEMIGEK